MVRFLVAFFTLSYIGSERHSSSDRNTVSQDCFLGAGMGAGGGVLERLRSKHRWLGACAVGRNSLAPCYVCRIWTFRRITTRSENNLGHNSDEGGSGGAGGAVSTMIQATSVAKYIQWWYWAGFLEPPFCWSKELNRSRNSQN